MTKQKILTEVRKKGIKFVNLQFVDILGIVKAVTIPVSKLEDAIDNNIWFDGSSIAGFARIFESDMFLKPDLNTFAVLPWQKNTARFICDVFLPDGSPFKGCPRYILRQQLEKAQKLGFTYNVGPELEFFLFEKDEEGNILPQPNDSAGYFDLSSGAGQKIRQEMSKALATFNIDVETLHHEVATNQHEIDFKYADALTTADRAITFKVVLKAIAQKYNLHATFMPKPIEGENGSGMHVHQSLFKNDKNIFYNKNGTYHLSETALSFIAGQLKYIQEFTALTNPTVNSYKRLVPGYEAPVYIAWGQTNRSALIRIPRYTVGRENATRCELRCPDPTANPYLAFAVMLASGIEGVEKKLTPPQSIEEDIFKFDKKEAKKHKIEHLPHNLHDAISNMEKSDLVKNVLGEYLHKQIVEAKLAEWNSYKKSVSEWELKKYLRIY